MILLVIALLLRVAAATSQSSLYITPGAPNGSLLKAFRNSAVTSIYFTGDYSVGDEFEAYAGVKDPLPLNRSVTLSGARGGEKPLLDFNFQFSVVEICSNCTVKVEHLAAANERRGAGHGFDFFVGQPGSLLILNDTYRVRLSCTQTEDALQFDDTMPRAPEYPGPPGEEDKQVALPYGVNVTYHGVQYLNSLKVVNMAIEFVRTFQELGAPQGGYVLVILNTVRLCAHTVTNACLSKESPDACVNEMIIELLAAPNTATTGGNPNELVTLVVPLVVGGVLAAAVVAVIMCVLWRRRRTPAAAASAAGGRSMIGGVDGQDLEAGQAHGNGEDGTSFDGTDASQHMHNKGWVLTHRSTAPLLDPVQDDRITFGALVGAGSFGKVYKGWWADREVAIKVIEHDQSNIAAVENEEMLMLTFNHPNVVRAYHFVTFTMSKTPTGSDAQRTGTTAINTSSNSSHCTAAVHNSSSSNPANAAPGSASLAALPGDNRPNHLASPGGFGSNAAGLRQSPLLTQLQQQQQQDIAVGAVAVAALPAPHNGIPGIAHPAVSQSPRVSSPRPGNSSRFGSDPVQQTRLQAQHWEAGSTTTSSTPLSPQDVDVSHERSSRSGSSSSSDVRKKSLSESIKDLHAGASSYAQQQQQQQQQQQNAQEKLGGVTPWSQDWHQQQLGVDGGVQHLRSPQRSKSAPDADDGQQQQHVMSPVQAVRPGSPRPGSPRPGSPRPGSPRPSGSHINGNGFYVCQSKPLSEVIDTSRWPGIIDYVSASARQKDTARAKTWLVLEFCDLGTLSNIASDWSPEHEGDEQMVQRLMLLRDAARGLQALHAKNVVHGDLNARNVLVSSNPSAPIGMVAKLADLGLSRVVKQHMTHRTTNTVGTMSHMPPELLRYGRMSAAVDLFAFGVMMWEVFTGQAAFRALHYGQFFEMVVLRNQRPPRPQGMPTDYNLLMEHCWSAAPQDRPSVDTLLECLSLMISDRQHNILNKQALCNRLRPAPPQAAAVAEQPLQQQECQQQQQGGVSFQASSTLPDPLNPAAGAGATLGLTAMSSLRSTVPDAVHARWEDSSASRTQSKALGRDAITPSGLGSGASSTGNGNTNQAGPLTGVRAGSNAVGVAQPTVHSIHESRQQSPHKLRPRRSSEPGDAGLNETSVTVIADQASLDQQQQKQQQQKQQQQKEQRPLQRLASAPLHECDLEGSQYIESW